MIISSYQGMSFHLPKDVPMAQPEGEPKAGEIHTFPPIYRLNEIIFK